MPVDRGKQAHGEARHAVRVVCATAHLGAAGAEKKILAAACRGRRHSHSNIAAAQQVRAASPTNSTVAERLRAAVRNEVDRIMPNSRSWDPKTATEKNFANTAGPGQ